MVGMAAWYERIFQHSVDGILILRTDGTILAANPAACRLFGRSEGQLRELGRDGLVNDHEYERAVFARWLADGLVHGEREVARPDGSKITIEFSAGKLPSDGDEDQIGYVIVRDLTSARRAAAATAALAERQTLLAAASRAFAEAGADERSVLDELARRATDALADSCQVRLVDDDGALLRLTSVHARDAELVDALRAADEAFPLRVDGDSFSARAVSQGAPVLLTYIDQPSFHTVIPAPYHAVLRRYPQRSLMAVPLRAAGRCIGSLALTRYRAGSAPFVEDDVAFVQDLADRAALTVHNARLHQRAAQELDERRRVEGERERLAAVIEQATEMVMVTDRFGAIQYVNPAFESVTGYARGEVQGKNPRILRSGAQSPEQYRSLWAAISSGKTWRGRLVNRKKDGSYYTEDAIIAPVRDGAGLVTGYFALKRDITRDLSLEAQLQQAQKMEGIGRLAGGVAHDFNNLLSVILGSARFALDALHEADPVRGDLLEIERAGERAAVLTRQLLAFSRRQALKAEPLDVNRVIGEMRKMLDRILGEDVALHEELAHTLGAVKADPGQIEQVIMNLVVNARDAMPHGGSLTIRTDDVEVDAGFAAAHGGLDAGPQVRISVTDTGIGMDEITQSRIFEPFFTTKEAGKGTGLGLSTVYGIVAQSGGRIHVASEVARGTTFNIYLPRIDATPVAPRSAQPPPKDHGSETILVVEDEDAVRRIVRRVLEKAGYRVLAAANGGEGLLLCEQHDGPIDLAISDVVMPIMSGPDFIERARRVRPGLRVLFMSGYTDDSMVRHGLLEGELDLVGKPLSQDELLQRVRAALEQRGATPPQ
ncbi:MAG: PAS domain S-box protein [Deltaproteobacteria bacterium]|nr:PAS domain S-box protein [Deltaproteobacteria bacterium]